MKPPIPLRRAIERMGNHGFPTEETGGRLRLDLNENTAGCSPRVRKALARLGRDAIARYPGYEATRRRLARYFGARPEELLLTNGTDDALRLPFDVFAERGSRVLLVEPTFAMYAFWADLAEARVVRLRYGPEMEFPMRDALRALRAGPRLFFLANPNNPTGTLLARSEIRKLLRAAGRTVVVVDEAYYDFSGVTVIDWIRRYPNLVVMRTFSKAPGLAALRLGCVFAERGTAQALHRAQPPFPVNVAALVAAEAAARDARYIRRYAREIAASKRELYRALDRFGIRAFPSGGNFLLADFGARAGAILRALRRQGILLRDRRSDFGGQGYVRITLGTRAETRELVRALERLWPRSDRQS
jgi:histidinol-phosphate aminotransferase